MDLICYVSFDTIWNLIMQILRTMLGNKPPIDGLEQSCGILIANATEIPKYLLPTLSRNNTSNRCLPCNAVNLFGWNSNIWNQIDSRVVISKIKHISHINTMFFKFNFKWFTISLKCQWVILTNRLNNRTWSSSVELWELSVKSIS